MEKPRQVPLTEDQLTALRIASTTDIEEGTPPISFTCDDCGARYTCEYVFDWYNTDGDCMAEK
jgi:hypothetical protein